MKHQTNAYTKARDREIEAIKMEGEQRRAVSGERSMNNGDSDKFIIITFIFRFSPMLRTLFFCFSSLHFMSIPLFSSPHRAIAIPHFHPHTSYLLFPLCGVHLIHSHTHATNQFTVITKRTAIWFPTETNTKQTNEYEPTNTYALIQTYT